MRRDNVYDGQSVDFLDVHLQRRVKLERRYMLYNLQRKKSGTQLSLNGGVHPGH